MTRQRRPCKQGRCGRRETWLDDPRLAGNPVARAHARASGEPATSSAAGSRIGRALVFVVVLPVIVFLVSNPVGWLLLFWLCLGFGLLFGFGGIL
jgi:hypothetical protein